MRRPPLLARGMQRRRGARAATLLLPRRRPLPARQSAAARPPSVTAEPPSRRRPPPAAAPAQRSMLQQMFSSSPQAGEVATAERHSEGRVYAEASSEASSDAADDIELPQCKIRRNYNCAKCTFFTQNPRVYLVHTRDVHFERFKIYDCPSCVYASRHYQKLNRHIKMVHGCSMASTSKADLEHPPGPEIPEHTDRIEDMVEEVEDAVDGDAEDISEETLESFIELDTESSRPATEGVATATKEKFFSCEKCNYVTHIRSRYTKHVKYHSMPMIKCTMCDFRTPYKWNLDRHMKNHGGTGSFHCSMCNFTADIKQSLTVHEMNHHTPPVGHTAASRRRNRVGASDVTMADEAAQALITKEEEGSGDSSHEAADMGEHNADIEMISCNSESNDGATTVDSDIKIEDSQATANDSSNQCQRSDEAKHGKQSGKRPRPIPQLIPLNASTPNSSKTNSPPGEPPLKKIKEMVKIEKDAPDSTTVNLPDISLIPIKTAATPKETPVRKKNESFFDKLKERLLTETGETGSLTCKNCGFESKCLSEHSVHEKNCALQTNRVVSNNSISSLGSTRCQNCRHRCKSSADLYVHMKTCGKTMKQEEVRNKEIKNEPTTSKQSSEVLPHPMENVVFVWNNINPDDNKFEMPLDISINDDSTLPDGNRTYEQDNGDENESMNLSPTQAIGKKVFKCPHCPFWASTASRFHVHIVGHLNKKPFECSLCKYKSNWRWDITKHIKLKSARDPEHNEAKVLMTDETGRRNYSKYNKFLAMLVLNNESGENEFHYIDQEAATMDTGLDGDESQNDLNDGTPLQPLDLHTQQNETKKPKKTLWKCKKCNYKDASKEALLEHVREHSRIPDGSQDALNATRKPEPAKDPADLAYQCGHCHQLSNWKHVIQRHCRLKHDGVIKVVAVEKPKQDTTQISISDLNVDFCTKCPFKTNDKKVLLAHMLQHTPSPQSIFKCYFCPFFVKNESELPEHLTLHGVSDPEDYISRAMAGAKSPGSESTSMKRHRCTDCPYETNSKSQYFYHEQFHRLPADTPYKCQECNYSVSKRHLLHQHMRVHGIFSKKNDGESESEASTSQSDNKIDDEIFHPEESPFVWVAAKNEFHKMFKCRYCTYVNSQKCKIPYHEKLHYISSENNEVTIYKCLECKFTSDNAFRLAEHSKSHSEIYGRIYCPVDTEIPDEEQISNLRKVLEEEKMSVMEGLSQDDPSYNDANKILHFCQTCPARFFTEGELNIHDKFHVTTFTYKCKSCEFSVPLENQLNAHYFVHTDEYRTKTKMLRIAHDTHPAHTEPKIELHPSPSSAEITWVVASGNKTFKNKPYYETKHTPKQYPCKECPAKFFKTSTLNYHMGLHGGDGDHKCRKCNYTVKNVGHLAKHELLHENETKRPVGDYDSGEDIDYKNVPISGTDLFQRKTEAQKRVLIDKDKLVKPNDHFPPVLQADPQFGYLMHGNPEFIYPTYMKNGRQKEKRYKCHKCPSAFEKREQYKIHLSLHGSKQRYKCELCDYSVKYYANYVQHMRKHQMNDEAQAERRKDNNGLTEPDASEDNHEDGLDIKLAIKTIPKSVPKSDFQQFSVSDQQTLRLIQRRRSMNNPLKEAPASDAAPVKDRKLHPCLLCPYTNQRQDALLNHYRRHDKNDVQNAGYQKCSHCDLAMVQSHFLRDHQKSHFTHQKTLAPECFAANEDVSFTITKLDEESISTELVMEIDDAKYKSSDEKMIVQISTGEILVE